MSIVLRSQRGPIGNNWWGRALCDTVEELLGRPRATRGRRAARAGRVQWIDVQPGRIAGAVTDTAPGVADNALFNGSNTVSGSDVGTKNDTASKGDVIRGSGTGDSGESVHAIAHLCLAPLSPDDRVVALHYLRAAPGLAAQLAGGHYPVEIEARLQSDDVSLLPAGPAALTFDCSCPEWPGPCIHVCALVFAVVEELDAAPAHLLTWRGLSIEDLIRTSGETSVNGPSPGAPHGNASPPGPPHRDALVADTRTTWASPPDSPGVTSRNDPDIAGHSTHSEAAPSSLGIETNSMASRGPACSGSYAAGDSTSGQGRCSGGSQAQGRTGHPDQLLSPSSPPPPGDPSSLDGDRLTTHSDARREFSPARAQISLLADVLNPDELAFFAAFYGTEGKETSPADQ
ncbi:SWIM zinc finger family protein [Devriesea agamarum]|uniref:SWIM zinc finger family protein n=1 Tax=Devriesea agamarum TaxID=472569 RepID=UPI00071D03AD|nr:hypothetical protein [Devriesea agamarum]